MKIRTKFAFLKKNKNNNSKLKSITTKEEYKLLKPS
jgi:hypothetical protein